MELSIKARIIRWSLRFWPLAFIWYRVTQVCTLLVRDDVPVRWCTSINQAVTNLGEGRKWKADRPVLDVMSHPRVVQARIDRGAKVGDCEDHAAYILSALRRVAFLWRPYVFTVQMVDRKTGKVSGHCIMGYSQEYGLVVADYGPPLKVRGENPFVAVGQAVADSYGLALLGVAWCEVGFDGIGGLRFKLRKGGHYRASKVV